MTQKNKPELLPCPFCGGEAEIRSYNNDSWATCVDKGCCNGFMCRNSKETESFIVDTWNTRHNQDELLGKNERLKKELENLTEKYNEATQRACNNYDKYYETKAELDKYKWISVDDRLPEEGEGTVIICFEEEGCRYVDCGSHQPCLWSSWDDWVTNVTHWQPLPDPPESQEKENK